MNILVVAPDFPFPPNHGGRADIWKRIELFCAHGHVVDLLCTAARADVEDADLEHVRGVVGNVYFQPRSYAWWRALGLKPFQVMSRETLRHFRPEREYEVVVFESEFVASALAPFAGTRTRKFLRVHNNESAYFWAMFCASTKAHHKLYYLSESVRFKFFSRQIKRASEVILHISHDEYQADLRGDFRDKVVFFPPHVPADELVAPASVDCSRALFVGNLFTENNVSGLRWYIDEVHPRVRLLIPGYKLVVAGNSRGKPPAFLLSCDDSIEFHESPVMLDGIYDSCGVFINPMLSGAGVKLKTVHAIERGIAVVSTSVGAEGIGLLDGRHYVLGNTAEAFATAVVSLLQSVDTRLLLARSAQDHLAKHFDNSKTLDALIYGNSAPSRS